MAKKSTSKHWLHEHHNDIFVKQAKQDGYRARAAYKLLEIIDKTAFIKAGDHVVDLGAAPGSWSQIAQLTVGKKGQVIASDILPIKPIAGVKFILGDFQQPQVYENITQLTANGSVDVVLSDMAPNMSGQPSVDIPRAMNLSELSFEFALNVLKKDGSFCCKVFQGEGFDCFILNAKRTFERVRIYKPKASRPRSKEVYLLANRLK